MTWKRSIEMMAIMATSLLIVSGWGTADERSGSYERAIELLLKGVVFEAIHELELFVAANPDDEKARMELARALHMVKRERRTAEEATQVLRINPENAEARRLLTRIRIKLGRELDRSDPVAVLDYARLCARPETYDRAADFYRLYLELDDNPLVHKEFARMLYWAEDYNDAERHLRVYLEEKPDDLDMRRLLGRIYVAMGSFSDAVSEFRFCCEAAPDDIELQLDLARSLMWAGKEAEAETILLKVRERSGEYSEPILLLASIAGIHGRVQEEYDLYRTVLESDPENSEAKARVKELEQGNRLAIAICLSRLATDPLDIESRMKLVDIYLSEERFGEAIPHLQQINSIKPNDPSILDKLRFARAEEGRRVLAEVEDFHRKKAAGLGDRIAKVEKWLHDNPNDYRTRVKLVEMLMENHDYDSAIMNLELLESMTPADAKILEMLRRARIAMQESAAETNSESGE